MEANKYDEGKVDWAILPVSAMEEVCKCFTYGENKYSRGNYAYGVGLSYSRLINSLLRHTFAFAKGQDIDEESGCHHMAHAACCAIMLLHLIIRPDESEDDREETILK